ncbi:ribosome recycling factor [Helicobacter sp. MIT 00-7814]|uniref:ribosome recycling factor n=1 Tax=unclassified Helicobacter TaxID=2593540 RepID=UPI000E1E6F0C|nr:MULTISPECIES: ribosome recycling factor [unclassified Helicobacter]RDU54586.1 ribosome recycling factor [Helicobacter sp. MIT 00-7814]RDU54645.1 ribosome recycling factor [Helicobacter sp. MIT 99-10781]
MSDEISQILKHTQESMEKSLNALKKDFSALRSGRVSTARVDSIKADYYETPTPLSQMSSIVVQDASTLVITPWDKGLLKAIERALQEANIGATPNNDGESIRLNFPPMTKEQRVEIAKEAKAMAEKGRVAVRNIRQDSNNALKKLEKAKTITEDACKKAHESVQKHTDDFVKKIDDALKAKEDEILKV